MNREREEEEGIVASKDLPGQPGCTRHSSTQGSRSAFCRASLSKSIPPRVTAAPVDQGAASRLAGKRRSWRADSSCDMQQLGTCYALDREFAVYVCVGGDGSKRKRKERPADGTDRWPGGQMGLKQAGMVGMSMVGGGGGHRVHAMKLNGDLNLQGQTERFPPLHNIRKRIDQCNALGT